MFRKLTSSPSAEPLAAEPESEAEPRPEPEAVIEDPRAREERLIAERIHEAVMQRRFHLHYQPVVSVTGGEVVGIEALLRLRSDVGRIRPEVFLPIVAEEGMWEEVGRWVLGEATRQALGWAGRHLWLTVNVSVHELEAGYADAVLAALEASRFPAELLCLEFSGTARLADPLIAWAELRRLKTQGIGLLIDDFGTAASSLADLANFGLEAVKIDPSFIAALGVNGQYETIVAAVINLAHALGMQAIAEGVETEAQLARLDAMGCDLAQGFHFLRPGEPDTIDTFMADTERRLRQRTGAHG